MTERKRAKAEARGYPELLREVNELEHWNDARKLKARGIPEEWRAIAAKEPEPKTEIRMPVDADVAEWFGAFGEDVDRAINLVLRAYMLAVLSKEIELPGDRDWRGAAL